MLQTQLFFATMQTTTIKRQPVIPDVEGCAQEMQLWKEKLFMEIRQLQNPALSDPLRTTRAAEIAFTTLEYVWLILRLTFLPPFLVIVFGVALFIALESPAGIGTAKHCP